MRIAVLCAVSLLATGLGLLLAPGAAGTGVPTGADQHFIGLVNGSRALPVVHTVCPGAATDSLGRVAGGQTLSLAEVRAGHGYTGTFTSIYAWFVPNASRNGHLAVRFTSYGTPKSMSRQVRVPCDGTGRVEFSSCPYLAPCAAGWIPDYVRVQFVNTATDR